MTGPLATANLKARVVPAGDLTAEEILAWDDLCRTGVHRASPFLTPHYTRAVAFARPYVYVCVLRTENRIAGFFPFQFRSTIHRMLGAAERVGGELTDYCGIVAAPDVRIDGDTLIQLAGLRHFLFTHLDESQSHYGLRGGSRDAGLLIDLHGGDYWQQLSERNKRFVGDSNRVRKRIQADHGPLRFCARAEDWQAPLEFLVRAKRTQYRLTGASDPLRPAWARRVLAALAASSNESCRGVLSTLHAGETLVASQFSLEGNGVHHDWFPVYNRRFSSYSPGRLLLWAVIESAPERGVMLIDRGAGDSHAKRQFANACHFFERGAWTQPGFRSLLYRASCSLNWRLARLRWHSETNRA